MRLYSVTLTACLLAGAAADLKCEDFVYGDSSTNKGFMFLPGIKQTTNGNLTVGKFLHVQKKKVGHVFALRNCSSESLSLSKTCVQNGDYFTNVQVVNPDTGHCMTMQPASDSNATINFEPCKADPKNKNQLWYATQSINPDAIGPVYINPMIAYAWEVKNDTYRTVFLNFETQGPAPEITTLNKTGKIPYSTNIQQCRV